MLVGDFRSLIDLGEMEYIAQDMEIRKFVCHSCEGKVSPVMHVQQLMGANNTGNIHVKDGLCRMMYKIY